MRRCGATSRLACFLVLLLLVALFPPLGPAVAQANTGLLDPAVLVLRAEPDGTATATVTVTDPNYRDRPSVNAGWVTITPAAPSSNGQTYTITASARGRKVGEVALARINFAMYPSLVDLPVVLAVGQQTNLPPVLSNPTQFDFGTVMPGQTPYAHLNLWFSAPASGRVTTDAPWLQVTSPSFAATQFVALSLKPMTDGLTPGQTYSATVEIDGDTAPVVKIPVTMRVADPQAPAPLPNPFSDVASGHWAKGAIVALSSWGVIKGLGPGQFGPDQAVTREQFARMLAATQRVPQVAAPLPTFTDVSVSRWSAPYIEAVKAWLPGDPDGRFHPETPVTRQDVAVALARAKGYRQDRTTPFDVGIVLSDQDEIAPSDLGAVAFVLTRKLMQGFGDGTFRPTAFLTRAQAAVLLYGAVAAPRYSHEDDMLAGVRLGQNLKDAEATLGAPEAERPGFLNGYTRVYQGGTVEVSYVTPSQTVWSIRLLTRGTTARGLAIGDPATQVPWLYGQPSSAPRSAHDGLLHYSSWSGGISIAVDDGRVSWIELRQSL